MNAPEWITIVFADGSAFEQAIVRGADGKTYLAIRRNGEFVTDVELVNNVSNRAIPPTTRRLVP